MQAKAMRNVKKKNKQGVFLILSLHLSFILMALDLDPSSICLLGGLFVFLLVKCFIHTEEGIKHMYRLKKLQSSICESLRPSGIWPHASPQSEQNLPPPDMISTKEMWPSGLACLYRLFTSIVYPLRTDFSLILSVFEVYTSKLQFFDCFFYSVIYL